MAADTLCSRVPKFIFLNKGKLTEASLVRTIASKDPSLLTLLGHIRTAANTAALIQVPHYPSTGGQTNSFRGLKRDKGGGMGLLNN